MTKINNSRPKQGGRALCFGLALLCLLPASAFAQNARLQLSNLEKLSDKAKEVNDVTLDGATLQLASAFMKMDRDPEADQIKEIFNSLQGIYIKNFEFDRPNEYSQEDVAAIRSQLSGPGWTRIVENREKTTGEVNEIYLMKNGDKIGGVAILVAEAKELTVVNIVGPIDLAKLSSLSGKFGIPNVNGQPKTKSSDGAGSSGSPNSSGGSSNDKK